MVLLVSYDIENNYFRKKIADHLLDTGLDRFQYSVYLGNLAEAVKDTLVKWLLDLQGDRRWGQKDSVLVLFLTDRQVREMLTIGKPNWNQEALRGEQHTMIF